MMDWKTILASKPHNWHYLRRYIILIENCQMARQEVLPLEAHHICPKSTDMFPEFSSFKKHPWNRCFLTKKQHRLAHLLIAKSYSWSASQSFCALKFFSPGISSRLFESLQIERNRAHSERMRGAGNPFYGKSHTEQSKAKMGLAAYSPEERRAIRKAAKLSNEGRDALVQSGKNSYRNLRTEEAKANHLKAMREFSSSEERKDARKASYRESFASREELKCPWCSKQSKHHGNMKRYHFDNCPTRTDSRE